MGDLEIVDADGATHGLSRFRNGSRLRAPTKSALISLVPADGTSSSPADEIVAFDHEEAATKIHTAHFTADPPRR